MKRLISKVAITFIASFMLFTSSVSAAQKLPVLDNVMATLKGTASQMDSATLRAVMLTHYKTLRLVDDSYNWVAPELAEISDQLLPPDLTNAHAITLLNDMAEYAQLNPYMVKFFKKAEKGEFSDLMEKSQANAAYILPAVIGYALVQERMTQAMYQDWKLIKVLMDIWVPVRQAYGIEAQLDTFSKMKLASVEQPMNDYIEFHTSGVVPEDYGKLDLPMNIFEATAEDLSADRRDNAKAGVILAFNLPGAKPSRLSEDGKAVLLSMPQSKKWADLYTIWNMAFVSHFEYFPFVMVKLMIPQVNNYADDPDAYMYNRSLALYTHLHFSFLGQFDQLMAGQEGMDWYDEELTEKLGKVARKSAMKYQASVFMERLSK